MTRYELAHRLNVLFWRREDVGATIRRGCDVGSPEYVAARRELTRQFKRLCEDLGIDGTDAELDNI